MNRYHGHVEGQDLAALAGLPRVDGSRATCRLALSGGRAWTAIEFRAAGGAASTAPEHLNPFVAGGFFISGCPGMGVGRCGRIARGCGPGYW
jgi:hypothetical protein